MNALDKTFVNLFKTNKIFCSNKIVHLVPFKLKKTNNKKGFNLLKTAPHLSILIVHIVAIVTIMNKAICSFFYFDGLCH